MNNVQDVIQATSIGIVIAIFLLNTKRILKAIELFSECLILLSNKALPTQHNDVHLLFTYIYDGMFQACYLINDYSNMARYGRKLIDAYKDCGKRAEEIMESEKLANIFQRQSKYLEAKELWERIINITKETGDKKGKANAYRNLGTIFCSLFEYPRAIECFEKALPITLELRDREGEAMCYGIQGAAFRSLGQHAKAEEYLHKALSISKEIGDRKGEAFYYETLGTVFLLRGELCKAIEYLEKTLTIRIEIGNREGEASSYRNLGNAFHRLGKLFKAKEYLEKACSIATEIGDRKGEANYQGKLGDILHSLGEYTQAKEYLEKAIVSQKEIGDRQGKGKSFATLAAVYTSLGEYVKAIEYLKEALAIAKEIGDRDGEAKYYGNIAVVYQSLGEYGKAQDCLEKALAFTVELGDRQEESTCYGNLAVVFQCQCEYAKAEEYLEKASTIKLKIGDRQGEAVGYNNIGTMLSSLGEYAKAKNYFMKALSIRIEIGDKEGEATAYGNLGTTLRFLGEYVKAEEYLEKALAISKEIADKRGEASSYGNLGTVFFSLGKYARAKEYFKRALTIRIKLGDREGEAADYINLGTLFLNLGDYIEAEDNFKKALSISKDIRDGEKQFQCLCGLTLVKVAEEKLKEALLYLFQCIKKEEDLRGFLKENDELKISFSDMHVFPYQHLSLLFYSIKRPCEALYAVELGRARALADLMSAQYCVEQPISADPQSWVGIENTMKKECNCNCLCISYSSRRILLWVVKTSGVLNSRANEVAHDGLVENLDAFLDKSFRSFNALPKNCCEDRSFLLCNSHLAPKSSQEDSPAACRLVEEDDEENEDPKASPSLCFKMIIAPVADLLDEPEIIIVPDRSLYRIPYAALDDESGKYLSETYKIRIVPSLTTLKLIQDSPADYHRQTGALIVGDPDVGRVHYKGYIDTISRLPCAKKEAVMIGHLLGAQPLIGKHATKQAVLESIHSVSLIHFAAHGDAERGEIALAPMASTSGIPQEKDFLLTMSDISKVRLRAKLVVLSCCHSGSGQIRAEGVVGIARAFLGSGARSVLAALWAIPDSATEQLMSRFYEHLVRGESASESLHQAMKWMRSNGYTDVRDWAPFMLIGDNVTFDFGK